MSYQVEDKLVVAIASSALFDLRESDDVFRTEGLEKYRQYQRKHETAVLKPGVAYPLVRRLLAVNSGFPGGERPIEVVLLSRNDPDTGLRVFNSIESHGLDITRAAFVGGRDPFRYMEAFNASLFISADERDVNNAIADNLPAGRVLGTGVAFADDSADPELRIAFDFDGVIADDASEVVYQTQGIDAFHEREDRLASEPVERGPLARFFRDIANLQRREKEFKERDESYQPRLRTAIVTARNAPAHKRVVMTLRAWDIHVDEVFFLGGINKSRILEEFRPHIFFDDQLGHIQGTAQVAPSVHIPFGVANERPKPG